MAASVQPLAWQTSLWNAAREEDSIKYCKYSAGATQVIIEVGRQRACRSVHRALKLSIRTDCFRPPLRRYQSLRVSDRCKLALRSHEDLDFIFALCSHIPDVVIPDVKSKLKTCTGARTIRSLVRPVANLVQPVQRVTLSRRHQI